MGIDAHTRPRPAQRVWNPIQGAPLTGMGGFSDRASCGIVQQHTWAHARSDETTNVLVAVSSKPAPDMLRCDPE